jgi:hypothetical protein
MLYYGDISRVMKKTVQNTSQQSCLGRRQQLKR